MRPAACARTSSSTDPAAKWCSKCWRYKDASEACPDYKPGNESLHAWRVRNGKAGRK